MKSILFFLSLFVFTSPSFSQSSYYVTANNGLFAREAPSGSADIITKLNYGTALDIVEHSGLKMDVMDNDKKISGEWVKVNAYVNYDYIEGYVFDGYLTKEKLDPRIHINFDTVKMTMDKMRFVTFGSGPKFIENDSVSYDVELGYTPEDKVIKIKPTINYRKVEVYQSYETSVTVMNEGPHCDLVDWKHYNSDWKKLMSISKNTFKSGIYSKEDWNQFIDVTLDDLLAEVKENCGDEYAKMVTNIKSVNEYPAGVSISTVYFKIVITDLKGKKIEKIVALQLPMGC